MMQEVVRLEDIYAALRPSAYGIALLLLCIYIGMTEGYDVQAMAMAAPLVAKAWALPPGAIGILLASSVVGQVVGSFLLSPLGDRWGRRPAIQIALLVAAIGTAAGAFAPDFASLTATRLVTGGALGLALSNTTALAMELVPVRWRAVAVVLVCCGYPLGASAGAAIVGRLLPVQGVAAVFYVGGAGTSLALLLCLVFLPESPVILARRTDGRAALGRVLVALGARIPAESEVAASQQAAARSPVAALLAPERRTGTLLLWLLNFANLSLVYFFFMWLPSLIVARGLDSRSALVATSLFNLSGIIGGLGLALLLRRIGAVATLGGCYAVTVAAVLLFSSIHTGGLPFFAALAACGATIVGSQFSLSAVANEYYPAEMRATGAGYALGAGRCGAVLAPVAGGMVLTRAASPDAAFAIGAFPAAISLGAILAFGRIAGRQHIRVSDRLRANDNHKSSILKI